eukprot:1470502-Rhodomonas_salina.2
MRFGERVESESNNSMAYGVSLNLCGSHGSHNSISKAYHDAVTLTLSDSIVTTKNMAFGIRIACTRYPGINWSCCISLGTSFSGGVHARATTTSNSLSSTSPKASLVTVPAHAARYTATRSSSNCTKSHTASSQAVAVGKEEGAPPKTRRLGLGGETREAEPVLKPQRFAALRATVQRSPGTPRKALGVGIKFLLLLLVLLAVAVLRLWDAVQPTPRNQIPETAFLLSGSRVWGKGELEEFLPGVPGVNTPPAGRYPGTGLTSLSLGRACECPGRSSDYY